MIYAVISCKEKLEIVFVGEYGECETFSKDDDKLDIYPLGVANKFMHISAAVDTLNELVRRCCKNLGESGRINVTVPVRDMIVELKEEFECLRNKTH